MKRKFLMAATTVIALSFCRLANTSSSLPVKYLKSKTINEPTNKSLFMDDSDQKEYKGTFANDFFIGIRI
ncbi:MAG: hypothetical protein ACRDE8_17810 [Ginsengibacter sp.]